MENASNQPHKKPSGGFGAGFLVATAIFIFILILGGIVWGGWWFYKKYVKNPAQKIKQEMQNQAAQQAGQSQSSATNYINNYFGFSVAMTPSWKEYKTTEEKMGGDYEVGRIGFYLPTSQKGWESSSMPGYFNAFSVSAYVKDSWDASQDGYVMGEEIGRNNSFVFVWSHFNGDPPSDVSEQAIRDMQTIVNSIQTFAPQMSGEQGSIPDTISSSSSYPGWETGTKPVRDADFDYDSVYYWNCKHSYTLNYPTAWSNNGMTFNSDAVVLKGNRAQVWVNAISIPAARTLQDFAAERANIIEGVEAWKEVVDWGNGTTVFRSTFTGPDSQALWWISNSGYGMELKAIGPGYNDNYTNIQNLIATLDPNSLYIGNNCGSASTPTKSAAPAQKSSSCSFPNGDVEYWWDSASAAEKQCYVDKYGAPSFYEP